VILPDLNVLIYAYNTTSSFHTKAASWWSKSLSGSETVALSPVVLFGFVRLATSARAFARPLTIEKASTRVQEWLEQPIVQLVETELQDVHQALSFLKKAGTGGNLTTDAQIAALSLRLGATVYTVDSDYARFAGVRWRNPFHTER
jgi:toxin-antitoxin system PIN domain toxin